MKILLENTAKIVTLVVNGVQVPARIWQGVMESPNGGIPVHCYITRVAVAEGRPAEDYKEFEDALTETAKMRPEIETIPLRLVL